MTEKTSCEDLQKRIREIEQRLSQSDDALKQLENSEHRYKTIFNASDDAILIIDSIDGSILEVNQKMMEMYGYSYAEALQLDFQSISEGPPPYSEAEAVEYLQKATSDSSQIFEWKAQRKNGDLFWVEVTLKRVVLDGADQVLATVRDITQRKKVDEVLRQSEEKFRTLTELSHVGTFLNDSQGKAIYVNPRCADIVGVPANEALNFDWVEYLHPDDRERVVNAWEKAVENNEPFKQEYRYVHPDGRTVWTRGEATPVINSLDEVTFFIGTMIDITVLKKAQRELQESGDLLRELFDNMRIGAAIYETPDGGKVSSSRS